ncbi:MAG: hypothetical protein NTZ78_02900, partial [Candidatus Aureabacteria bacterium]|nr:hypothetical protein [Candidatus Auribacterota bacterium]
TNSPSWDEFPYLCMEPVPLCFTLWGKLISAHLLSFSHATSYEQSNSLKIEISPDLPLIPARPAYW